MLLKSFSFPASRINGFTPKMLLTHRTSFGISTIRSEHDRNDK
jgi:hypothetical protein